MFPACLVSTLLFFFYTLRCFYIFSGTNLLKSCHSASCMFSSFFGSRKAENQYSRNWTGKKPKSIFYRGQHEARRRDEDGSLRVHTPWPCRWAHPAPRGCTRPSAPLACPFAYKKPPTQKP